MDYFNYRNGKLYVEDVPVEKLTARYGTPLYVYSRNAMVSRWQEFDRAFQHSPHLICYALKANSNLALLHILVKLGSGFDIVSQGELERVLAAGGQADKVVFSGVAKSTTEIKRALEVGIRCFNVESVPELLRINEIAGEMNCQAPVSLRINPDVDAKTHPYISTGLKENKFGISHNLARDTYRLAAQLPNIQVVGMDCHIGSQLTTLSPFVDALERLLTLLEQLKVDGIEIKHLDIGGGLGVVYNTETPPTPTEYVEAVMAKLSPFQHLEIILEPGRAIVANAGILVTSVEYLKEQEGQRFAIVDSGMHHLIRPALYDAWMNIIPVNQHETENSQYYDVVGPICETSDVLGKHRLLSLKEGDLLAVCSAGAYGFSMASQYNSHCRPAEILVDGEQIHLIREREKFIDLWQHENIIE